MEWGHVSLCCLSVIVFAILSVCISVSCFYVWHAFLWCTAKCCDAGLFSAYVYLLCFMCFLFCFLVSYVLITAHVPKPLLSFLNWGTFFNLYFMLYLCFRDRDWPSLGWGCSLLMTFDSFLNSSLVLPIFTTVWTM